MSLKITVTDEQTNETETRRIAEGDYAIICAHPCEVHSFAEDVDRDLVVVKIKNHLPLPLPEEDDNEWQ